MELGVSVMQSGAKILSVMQPTYLPWLGYFNLINSSDIFVIYDTVQLMRRSWQVRNKIKTSSGIKWLSIPVKKTQSRDDLFLKNAFIDYSTNWQNNHLSLIKHTYSRSLYFDEIFPVIEKQIVSSPLRLTQLTVGLILEFTKMLDIKTEIVFSADIDYEGKKDEALISICNNFGNVIYKSVPGSADYILEGENLFKKNNIPLVWQQYNHPQYSQLHNDFVSHLPIIDALFNVGIEETKKLIVKQIKITKES